MKVWIFSDLHLTDPDSRLYQSFVRTLSQPQSANDTVVFSGDIFDLLIGDSQYFKTKFADFFSAVEKLVERGANLHYIEGNHDFHLKNLFPSSVKFHEDSVVLTDQSVNPFQGIYIAHGDLVDQNDRPYQNLRRLLRSGPIQALSKTIPGPWVEAIGNYFSRPLDQKAGELPERWEPAKLTHLRRIFRNFAAAKKSEGHDFVILGHCHDLDQTEPYYFNMGYPPIHRQYLYYESNPADLSHALKRVAFDL